MVRGFAAVVAIAFLMCVVVADAQWLKLTDRRSAAQRGRHTDTEMIEYVCNENEKDYFVKDDRGMVSHLIFHAVEGDMKIVRRPAAAK